MATPASKRPKRPLTIILTGKSGAGKSTLKDRLLGHGASQEPSPGSVTKEYVDRVFKKNGIDIRIIDTLGLRGKKEDEKALKKCSAYTDGKIDLLIYSVTPALKFEEANPEIMTYIAQGFKKQIWEHCVLVLTMSNQAFADFKEIHPDEKKAAKRYIKFLKNYSDMFQEKLQELQVRQQVKTIFELKKLERDTNTTIAVPAARAKESNVLPGLKCELPSTCEDKTWISVMIEVMAVKCPLGLAPSILEYQYGLKKIVAGAALGGAALGAAGGGGAGALVGAIGGPLGIGVGAGVGLVISAGVAAVVRQRQINNEKENIVKEVEEQLDQEESQNETSDKDSEEQTCKKEHVMSITLSVLMTHEYLSLFFPLTNCLPRVYALSGI